MELPYFEGWKLLGEFPDNATDDVGSWLLVHNGEALLLEIPPGVTAKIVKDGLKDSGAKLLFATASHDHEDHFDTEAWDALKAAFPKTKFMHPSTLSGDTLLHLGGEPLWLIAAPKHSATDVVTVFRGVAMTGDIELGMLGSVNREVPVKTKRKSMLHLQGFCERSGYHVHSTVSAHLNSVRLGVHWPDLFNVALEQR